MAPGTEHGGQALYYPVTCFVLEGRAQAGFEFTILLSQLLSTSAPRHDPHHLHSEQLSVDLLSILGTHDGGRSEESHTELS